MNLVKPRFDLDERFFVDTASVLLYKNKFAVCWDRASSLLVQNGQLLGEGENTNLVGIFIVGFLSLFLNQNSYNIVLSWWFGYLAAMLPNCSQNRAQQHARAER